MDDEQRRRQLQYAQLAAYLQRAAALANELGEVEQSRRLYEDSNAAAQKSAPAAYLSQRQDQEFEHEDERQG